jgi:hypothetical protein
VIVTVTRSSHRRMITKIPAIVLRLIVAKGPVIKAGAISNIATILSYFIDIFFFIVRILKIVFLLSYCDSIQSFVYICIYVIIYQPSCPIVLYLHISEHYSHFSNTFHLIFFLNICLGFSIFFILLKNFHLFVIIPSNILS